MQAVCYRLAVALACVLQALPLPLVAWFGRRGGALAYWLDARHRRVALANLAASFPDLASRDIRALAREHFRRLGENYAAAVKTTTMSLAELAPHFSIIGQGKLLPASQFEPPRSRMLAVGHFGNFELYARIGHVLPGFQLATTYRALKQPRLNQLVLSLRRKSGCLLFDRRHEAAAFKKLLRRSDVIAGLLADQHTGRGGVRAPFFARDCFTNRAVASLAQRYKLPLHTAICFRVGLAQWRIEIGDEIPTFEAGARRPLEDIIHDVNAAFECAVRRDPANWLWVHNRWKNRSSAPAVPAPASRTQVSAQTL